MPTYVVKPDRERDEYVCWSTVVESPVFVGTRSETQAFLAEHYPKDVDPVRLDRADEKGSSALWPSLTKPYLGWDDETIYEQRGFVKARDLATLARRLEAGEDVSDLIEPFDDTEED